MRKRIASALLTLVMLLTLVPAMGTTAQAAGESHPKAANGLKEGEEVCLFWQGNDGSIVQYILKNYSVTGANTEQKWNNFKTEYPLNSNRTVNSADGNQKQVKGLAYYDPASGTLYLLGQIGSCSFTPTTDCSDVLTVIVDGDTTLPRGWCGYRHKGLGKMNIEFRNNATLNIPEPGKDMYGYPKAAALDITWTAETGRNDPDPEVKEYGELELRGTGKLNIVSPYTHEYSYSNMRYGIQADTVTIKDNVSLNIVLQRGTKYSSGILCRHLIIDTTGTVNIDVSNPRDDYVTAIRSIYNTDAENYGFYLKNAQSVTLKTQTEGWVLGNKKLSGSGTTNIYSTMCTNLEGKGWTVTKSAYDAVPYTVTMTRTATLGGATLNVGGIAHPAGDKNFNHVVTSNDASKKLFVSFDAGPQWFTTYYLKNKIKLNASVSIWEAGVRKNDITIVQSAGGLSEGRLSFTLDVGNLDLQANNTYTVSLYVDPTLNGERLAGDYLLTQWTFRTQVAPVIEDISTVGLKQHFYLTSDSIDNEPEITIGGVNQPYTITEEGSWTNTSGETYTRTVTLKANEGYKFTSETKVTAVNNDGAKPVDDAISTVLNPNGTLSVTITTYKRYTVDFLNSNGNGGMATQYVKSGEKAVAPENRYAPPSELNNPIFTGWTTTQGGTDVSLVPGDQTAAITANTKYYAVFESAPTYSITLSKHSVNPKVVPGETLYLRIENTGTADTGNLTVFFKMNSGNHFKFTNDVESVEVVGGSETLTPITTDVTLKSDASELTIPSIAPGKIVSIKLELPDATPVGDYGCAVQVKSAAGGSSTLKSNAVLVKTTVAKQVTVNLYRNDTLKGWPYDVPFVGDVVNLAAVDQNETTGMGPLGAHETFVGWTANKSEIAFEDPTAMTTKFVMPDIDVSSEELAITANFVTATVNGITITQMPAKTVYTAGENFIPTGIVVKPTYTDGTMGDALDNASLTYTPNTSLTASTNFVSVSYRISSDTWVAQVPITVTDPAAPTYTVSYDANGGTGTMAPDTATEGVPFTLPLCTFTPPTDKMFDKWDINGTRYASGASVDISTDPTIVKAIWKDIPNDGSVTLVNPPTLAVGPFTYDGLEKTGVATGSGYGLTGDPTATNAGTYTAIAFLNNHSHYWTDGTQMPKMFEWTINPASQAAPTGPLEMASRTTDSITLTAIPGAEYSMDGSYWQSSTEFTGLSSGTGYTFYARYAAKTNYNPSDAITETFYTLSGGSSSDSGSTGSAAYAVTILDSKNGSVTADRKTAPAETTVTLTVAPDKGYTLETLTVLDKDGKELKLTAKDGKYTFTMPAGAVEVKATFMDDNTMLNFFVDVKPGDFFYEAVLWAVKNGITNGISATEFGPNLSCTRAQIVTFLWRAAGSPAPKSTAMPFSDVKAGSYYEQAVLWAVENGITSGTGDGKFSPDATCTRAQAVTFLYRASGSPAVSGGSTFSDVAENAYYADAVVWAEKNGITGGIGGGLFGSDNDCTRGQIVTLLYRAYSK